MDIAIAIVKVLYTLIFIYFLYLMLFWDLPKTSFYKKIIGSQNKFIYRFGLAHEFSLFSPTPVSQNYLISFEIENINGSVILFELDGFTMKDDYQFSNNVRYAKLHHHYLSAKETFSKKSVCQYVLREYLKNQPTGIPKCIHLMRYSQKAPKSSPEKWSWRGRRIYTYPVFNR